MLRGDIAMQNETGDNSALLQNLMQRLSEDDKKKLNSILADREACEKLIKSPEALRLMRELGGKRNG
jgi:hypothetical protein